VEEKKEDDGRLERTERSGRRGRVVATGMSDGGMEAASWAFAIIENIVTQYVCVVKGIEVQAKYERKYR